MAREYKSPAWPLAGRRASGLLAAVRADQGSRMAGPELGFGPNWAFAFAEQAIASWQLTRRAISEPDATYRTPPP